MGEQATKPSPKSVLFSNLFYFHSGIILKAVYQCPMYFFTCLLTDMLDLNLVFNCFQFLICWFFVHLFNLFSGHLIHWDFHLNLNIFILFICITLMWYFILFILFIFILIFSSTWSWTEDFSVSYYREPKLQKCSTLPSF